MLSVLLEKLYGTFTPTGAFSFEFKNPDGKLIAEYIFLLPPESYKVSESQRGSVDKTLSGGYWADFGSEFKDLSLSGSLNFYYYSENFRSPAGSGSNSALLEFEKMRFLLSRYRDYTLTRSGRLIAPSFSGVNSGDANAVKTKALKKQGYADDIDVIFHAYDFDDHYYVRVETFDYNLDKADPDTINYNVKLLGIEQYEFGKSRKSYSKKLKKLDPKSMLSNTEEIIANMHNSTQPEDNTISGLDGGSISIPNATNKKASNSTNINAVNYSDSDSIYSAITAQIASQNLIPVQGFEIFQLNEKLKKLRKKFNQAITKIKSNLQDTKTAMGTIISDMQDTISEIKQKLELQIIPEDQYDNYKNGDIALTEYADFDGIEYYNGLTELSVGLRGGQVALSLIQDFKKEPLYTKNNFPGTFDNLDTDDYSDRYPVTERPVDYIFYTIENGDTLQSIAIKNYDGDYTKWPEISRVNNISDSDLIYSDYTGRVIRIPKPKDKMVKQIEDNLVFEKVFGGNDKTAREKYIYGGDIFLKDGKIQISSGDIIISYGKQNVISALIERLDTVKGGLNPLHTDFGVSKLDDDGKKLPVLQLENHFMDREAQANTDPRVSIAYIARDSVIVNGDRFDAKMVIELISSESVEVPISIEGII